MTDDIDTHATTVKLEAIIANDDNIIMCCAKWHTHFTEIYREAIRGVCADKCDGYNNDCQQYLPYTTMLERIKKNNDYQESN